MTAVLSARRHPLPGVELFTLEAGDGPLVLLMHGVTANAYVWEPVMERLAGTFRAISLDQRGHGRSGRPPGAVYAAEHFAADVAALVSRLGGGPAFLVGHSLGSRNALVAAARYPALVAGVVAVDFTPHIETAVFDTLDERVGRGLRRFESLDAVRHSLRERYPRLPADAIERRARYGYTRADDGAWVPLADLDAMVTICTGLREDLVPAVRALRVPTLLVRGADSLVVSPEALARTRQLRPDLPALVLDGADHYVHEEQPAALATAIHEFLTGLGSEGR